MLPYSDHQYELTRVTKTRQKAFMTVQKTADLRVCMCMQIHNVLGYIFLCNRQNNLIEWFVVF